MTDLEALKAVLSLAIINTEDDVGNKVFAQVQGIINRVEAAKPLQTAYAVLKDNGIGVWLEEDIGEFKDWAECYGWDLTGKTDKQIAEELSFARDTVGFSKAADDCLDVVREAFRQLVWNRLQETKEG